MLNADLNVDEPLFEKVNHASAIDVELIKKSVEADTTRANSKHGWRSN